jgi:hypothetical protein
MDPVTVEKTLIGVSLIQDGGLLASLSDKDFDGSEPPLFVLRGDRELLSLGDVLGKGLETRRRGFAFIHENEEPSHGTQDDQEEYESDQEDNLSEIQSPSKNKPQPFRTAALSIQFKGKILFPSFRRKPESSLFIALQKAWTPFFNGVTTAVQTIKERML